MKEFLQWLAAFLICLVMFCCGVGLLYMDKGKGFAYGALGSLGLVMTIIGGLFGCAVIGAGVEELAKKEKETDSERK